MLPVAQVGVQERLEEAGRVGDSRLPSRVHDVEGLTPGAGFSDQRREVEVLHLEVDPDLLQVELERLRDRDSGAAVVRVEDELGGLSLALASHLRAVAGSAPPSG